MADTQTDLLIGLAGVIGDGGAGVYDPARTWTETDTEAAVVFGRLRKAPDRQIVLTGYRLGPDDPAHPTGQINVQAYFRGRPNDPFDADGMAAAVRDLFNGMSARTFGSCTVTTARHKSTIPAGYDTNNRREVSVNFTFDVDEPATALRAY